VECRKSGSDELLSKWWSPFLNIDCQQAIERYKGYNHSFWLKLKNIFYAAVQAVSDELQ